MLAVHHVVQNFSLLTKQQLGWTTTELYITNEICVIPRDEKDIVSHCALCVFVQSSPVVQPAE